MHSMRNEAKLMNSAKLKRMGIEGKTESKMYGAEKMPPMMDTDKPAGAMPNRKRFNTGGAVLGDDMMEGDAPKRRLDKSRRGGKGGSTVNIVIAPQGGAEKPAGGMQPPMGMVAPPSPPPPPQPPGIPPQALAALAGAAGGAPKPPAMMNRGGRAAYKRGGVVKKADGGKVQGLAERIGGASTGEIEGAIKKGVGLLDTAMASGALDRMKAAEEPKHGVGDASGGGSGGGNGGNGMKRGGSVKRATGGKVYDAGAGTGEGRLEKKAAYGKRAYEGEKR